MTVEETVGADETIGSADAVGIKKLSLDSAYVDLDKRECPPTFNVSVTFCRLTEDQCAQLERFVRNLEVEFARGSHVEKQEGENGKD